MTDRTRIKKRALALVFIIFIGVVTVYAAAEIVGVDKATLLDRSDEQVIYYYENITSVVADDKCLADIDAWLVANPEPDNKTVSNETYSAWSESKPKSANCYTEHIEQVQKESRKIEIWQDIEINNKVTNSATAKIWAYEDGNDIFVKSNLDGDGFTHRKEIKPGTSYCVCHKDTGACDCYGHLKMTLKEALGAVNP